MAGLYIHIPFCRRACHYCNFHFSTNRKNKPQLVDALLKEIDLQHAYLSNNNSNYLTSIYLGGGTPSLLTESELNQIFEKISQHFSFDIKTEITLEANPDDLIAEKISELKRTPINRLSIGVQSFFDEDLKLMNRAHSRIQAFQSVNDAADKGFENITIDLMYALPTLSNEKWIQNLDTAFALPINHLSCYNLTLEEGTALMLLMKKGKVTALNETNSIEQFQLLTQLTAAHGFEHYEISNFAKNKKYAVHNSSYWRGENYLGIGPSAHSYNGISRQWNVPDNNQYIHAIANNSVLFEKEILSIETKFNEYILTGLRTKWGVNKKVITEKFGSNFLKHFETEVSKMMEQNYFIENNDTFTLKPAGKLMADAITSQLFIV